jgi:hypothetical protein
MAVCWSRAILPRDLDTAMEVRTYSAFGRLLSARVFAGAMAADVLGVVSTLWPKPARVSWNPEW